MCFITVDHSILTISKNKIKVNLSSVLQFFMLMNHFAQTLGEFSDDFKVSSGDNEKASYAHFGNYVLYCPTSVVTIQLYPFCCVSISARCRISV